MKKILVSGSLAYDYLFVFPGVFQDKMILDSKGALSVAFNVVEKTINFGGCAGNIAFNGKLLKQDFILFGIAGRDFEEYRKWLSENKISTKNVFIEKSEYTSQAAVVTDKKGQQITFFHEGAAAKSKLHAPKIKKIIARLAKDTVFALVSPNNREFVLASIEACKENSIKFFFDPGQAMPLFTKDELKDILQSCIGIFLNEYELEFLQKQLEMKLSEILQLCNLIIVTLGEKGSVIYFGKKEIKIPPGKPKVIKDPTGCGDAYRAGFLTAIQNSYQKLTPEILERAGQLGTKIALSCLGSVGTQNHKF